MKQAILIGMLALGCSSSARHSVDEIGSAGAAGQAGAAGTGGSAVAGSAGVAGQAGVGGSAGALGTSGGSAGQSSAGAAGAAGSSDGGAVEPSCTAKEAFEAHFSELPSSLTWQSWSRDTSTVDGTCGSCKGEPCGTCSLGWLDTRIRWQSEDRVEADVVNVHCNDMNYITFQNGQCDAEQECYSRVGGAIYAVITLVAIDGAYQVDTVVPNPVAGLTWFALDSTTCSWPAESSESISRDMLEILGAELAGMQFTCPS